jgi:hypothetical protein
MVLKMKRYTLTALATALPVKLSALPAKLSAKLPVRLAAVMLSSVLLVGCPKPTPPPPPPVPAERVLLMYDNIGSDFADDVKEAGAAVADGALGKEERVVVFHRKYSIPERAETASVVYELVADKTAEEGFSRKMLKQYGPNENDDLSPEVIASVVGDARRLVPADHYGLAFGSHGKGWMPSIYGNQVMRYGIGDKLQEHSYPELWGERENPLTRYLESERGEKIDNSEFVNALDEWSWDFILLDDCFMASVESLYDMRTLADYIIASPAEIYIDGFPYDRVVGSVFSDWSESGFMRTGFEYVDHYRHSVPDFPYGTVAVVKTAELDALALAVKNLRMSGFRDDLNPDTDNIQSYEGFRNGHVFYDLDHYLECGTLNPGLLSVFRSQLEKTVVFADHTDRFYSNFGYRIQHDITHYSGLSVFVPWSGNGNTAILDSPYRQTEWYKFVYGE